MRRSARVRQAAPGDVPTLVALFQELEKMQRDWRVFTPRPGFYDQVAHKYREAMRMSDAVVLVAEDDGGDVVGMAYGEVNVPSRFSDERALEISGVVVRAGHRGRGVGRALVREAARFAATHGIPWIEVRGVSNIVEDRDLKKWDIPRAAQAAQQAVQQILEVWNR